MKTSPGNPSDRDVRELVREGYAKAARRHLDDPKNGASCCCSDPISEGLYGKEEAGQIPEGAFAASLGCGNPTALAQLNAGETVLDLGSGGGVDVLLSARRVGPTGFAYGLDMTDEMLELAERHRAESGATNVRFLKGTIEEIPLPDESVDVILSNCVINLSSDKDRVLREAFRVLRPGGRFAVSDIVVEGELSEDIRRDVLAYVGCIAGALSREDYEAKLRAAGFEAVTLTPTRVYTRADLEQSRSCCGTGADPSFPGSGDLEGRIVSSFIRANKPARP